MSQLSFKKDADDYNYYGCQLIIVKAQTFSLAENILRNIVTRNHKLCR